jgi:hypothetical protein
VNRPTVRRQDEGPAVFLLTQRVESAPRDFWTNGHCAMSLAGNYATAVEAAVRRRRSRISRSLKSQLALQTALGSMEELSVRYMELSRTSLDIFHTYGTHVNNNMSISVKRSAETVLKPQSARQLRSSRRPIHWKPHIHTCRSRRARNSQR